MEPEYRQGAIFRRAASHSDITGSSSSRAGDGENAHVAVAVDFYHSHLRVMGSGKVWRLGWSVWFLAASMFSTRRGRTFRRPSCLYRLL